MSNTTALLSLVVPVFNEEENIPLLTERICTVLNRYTYELIFIDDCSTDNTREAVKKMNNPKVVLVELKKNYGQSLAMAAGFEVAQGEYVVTLDGDLQNDPDDIPAMLDKVIK